jgi:hypothetical protein
MSRIWLILQGNRRFILIAAGALWATSVWATSELETLRELLDRGRVAEVWSLAEKLEPESAGDPLFDLLYARAALAAGQSSKAIFALERVRITKPFDRQAWLLLVQAHRQAGDRDRARRELEALEASVPPESVARELRALRPQLIPPRFQPFSMQLGLAYGYDSNVNSAPDETIIRGIYGFPDVAFATWPETRAQSDTFVRLSATLGSEIGLGRSFYAFGGATGHVNALHDWTVFNTSFTQVRAGLGWRDNTLHVSLPLSRRILSVNHSLYNTTDTAALEWSQIFLTSHRLAVGTGIGASQSAVLELLDNRFKTTHASWGMFWQQFRFDLGFRSTKENPRVEVDVATFPYDNTFMGREHRAITVDLRLQPLPRHVLQLTSLRQQSRNDGINDVYALVREDTLSMVRLLWEWRVLRNVAWRIEAQSFNNDSNIAYYAYRRTQVLTGVTYEIH